MPTSLLTAETAEQDRLRVSEKCPICGNTSQHRDDFDGPQQIKHAGFNIIEALQELGYVPAAADLPAMQHTIDQMAGFMDAGDRQESLVRLRADFARLSDAIEMMIALQGGRTRFLHGKGGMTRPKT